MHGECPASRAFRVLMEIPGQLALMESAERMDLLDSLEIQDHKEALASKDCAVTPVLRVFPGSPERPVCRELKESLEILELKVQLERQAPLEVQALRVQQDHKVPLVCAVAQVVQVLLDLKESKVILVFRAMLVLPGPLGCMENLALREQLVHKDLQGIQETKVELVSLALLEYPEFQEQLVIKDQQGT